MAMSGRTSTNYAEFSTFWREALLGIEFPHLAEEDAFATAVARAGVDDLIEELVKRRVRDGSPRFCVLPLHSQAHLLRFFWDNPWASETALRGFFDAILDPGLPSPLPSAVAVVARYQERQLDDRRGRGASRGGGGIDASPRAPDVADWREARRRRAGERLASAVGAEPSTETGVGSELWGTQACVDSAMSDGVPPGAPAPAGTASSASSAVAAGAPSVPHASASSAAASSWATAAQSPAITVRLSAAAVAALRETRPVWRALLGSPDLADAVTRLPGLPAAIAARAEGMDPDGRSARGDAAAPSAAGGWAISSQGSQPLPSSSSFAAAAAAAGETVGGTGPEGDPLSAAAALGVDLLPLARALAVLAALPPALVPAALAHLGLVPTALDAGAEAGFEQDAGAAGAALGRAGVSVWACAAPLLPPLRAPSAAAPPAWLGAWTAARAEWASAALPSSSSSSATGGGAGTLAWAVPASSVVACCVCAARLLLGAPRFERLGFRTAATALRAVLLPALAAADTLPRAYTEAAAELLAARPAAVFEAVALPLVAGASPFLDHAQVDLVLACLDAADLATAAPRMLLDVATGARPQPLADVHGRAGEEGSATSSLLAPIATLLVPAAACRGAAADASSAPGDVASSGSSSSPSSTAAALRARVAAGRPLVSKGLLKVLSAVLERTPAGSLSGEAAGALGVLLRRAVVPEAGTIAGPLQPSLAGDPALAKLVLSLAVSHAQAVRAHRPLFGELAQGLTSFLKTRVRRAIDDLGAG